MKYYFTFFFFLITFFSLSQNEKPSFEKKISYLLKQQPKDFRVIDSLFKPYKKDETKTLMLVKRSKKANYVEAQLYGHSVLGKIYRDFSLFDKALLQHKSALELSRKVKNINFEIRTLNSIGSVYRRQDDVKNALKNHQKALSKALSIKNPNLELKKSISISQNSLGNIYITLKQYKYALKEFSKSIIIQKELNHKLGLAINYQNIGRSNEELGDLKKALENYTLSLNYNNQINSRVGKIICNNSIASVLIKQKKYEEALKKVKSVLPLALSNKDNYYLSSTYNFIGLSQVYLNNLEEAEKNLTKALDLATKYKIQNTIISANENLALLSEKKNSYKLAYFYYRKAKEEESKNFNERNLSYVNELISNFEKNRAEIKIKDLEIKNERNSVFLIIFLISVVLLGVIFYSVIRHRNLNKDKKLLSLKQEALQSQMNPHFVFNALNSIKLYIINNEQKNAVRYLNKFAKLIRKILEASKIKEISLQEELDTIKLYTSIENIRFDNQINYSFDI